MSRFTRPDPSSTRRLFIWIVGFAALSILGFGFDLGADPGAAAADGSRAESPSLDRAGSPELAAETRSRPAGAAGPWPGWRGADRDSKVDGPPWPSDFSRLQKVWAVDELGPSYSGPIVGKERVFTTETRDKTYEVVSAFDRGTGKLIWTRQWDGSVKVPFFAAKNGSWIRSTPAYDGETLYVGGIREVLVALDGATGALKWRLDFPAENGVSNPPFGFVCSPLVVGEHVYVEAANALFKLDKRTGTVIWKSESFSAGDMASDGTFSSPVLAELAGKEQLVVQTRLELVGLDPRSGRVLWRRPVPNFRGMNILTPLVHDDTVFTSTYRNATYLFAVEAPAGGGDPTVRELWQNTAQGYMSSPVEIDGVGYLHLGNGRLTAFELQSGKRLWTTQPFGPYWSMVAQGNRLLALDADGELIYTRVDRSGYEVLDRRQISDRSTWAHLAVADDQLVIRDLHGLTLWRWADGPEPGGRDGAGDNAEVARSAGAR